MAIGSERRRDRRAGVAMGCRLSRSSGSPISGRTVDLGLGGMSVKTARPLRIDEVLDFALPGADGAGTVTGRGRVMREQAYQVYAVRFEVLEQPARERLRQLL
jgi:hypothetical protein